jgi:hypothetical protein
MLALETAQTWWHDHSTIPFEERLGWHLSCGLVYSTRSAFMLASEVHWSGLEILSGPPNAWFLELAVAKGVPLSLFMQVAPHPREWVLFKRNNGFLIHSYPWERMAKRLKLMNSSPLTLS